MDTVLIVDDEINIRKGLKTAFETEDYRALIASDGYEAWQTILSDKVDIVITDLKMEGMSGSTLLKKIHTSYPNIPVIMITGHGSVNEAVDAMRNGAANFFTKPVDIDHLILTVNKLLKSKKIADEKDQIKKELDELKSENIVENKILGHSEKALQLKSVIKKVAKSSTTVLVTGQTGVGKELVASSLHAYSNRKDKPFIAVNCAAFTSSLIESELFGHEKGAFTSAISLKKGCFERADGGTLFLDEIGEIDAATQVKLLRVLQEREFERVGGQNKIKVDVRLVAATNKDLEAEVEKGNFRQDLYYRLNVLSINVPSLNERTEDIAILTDSFIKEYNKINDKNILGVSSAVRKIFLSYSWPGNIRELKAVIESSLVMADGDEINIKDLPSSLQVVKQKEVVIPLNTKLKDVEKIFILQTIKYTNGNKTKAAELLGIERKTLYRKLETLDIEV